MTSRFVGGVTKFDVTRLRSAAVPAARNSQPKSAADRRAAGTVNGTQAALGFQASFWHMFPKSLGFKKSSVAARIAHVLEDRYWLAG